MKQKTNKPQKTVDSPELKAFFFFFFFATESERELILQAKGFII